MLTVDTPVGPPGGVPNGPAGAGAPAATFTRSLSGTSCRRR